MSSGYSNPFSVCFTTMKIRYTDYDKSIDTLNFVKQDDKVNVFINFESVLNNLSMVKDIDNKLLLERNFPTILESEMINLCAHYKRFFRGNGLDTRVFLYYTDLVSPSFENFKYNDEYRSYYTNKYLNNPRFQLLGNKLVERIIPKVKTIMEFIPNVYFINGKGIEGSLIPWIIANEDPTYKNFIISTDRYDTQYQLYNDKYCLHYIKKSPLGASIFCTFDKYISDLFKENMENNPDGSVFTNVSFYSTLMSALGDKLRSIEPLKGVGCKTIMKYLNSGIDGGILTKQTNNFDMIKKSLPEEHWEKAEENFNCINLEKQYNALSQQRIFDVTNQIVDRFDYNSLLKLNREDYLDFPLMLPELTS
jgi:hypothetical protein